MKTHMPWQQADIPWDAIEQAMEHCDRVGLGAFRQDAHQGFKAAKGKGVMHQQRGPYEPRPLVAAAYAISYPQQPRLGPKDFTGDAARQYLLRSHGFTLGGESPLNPTKPTAATEQTVTLNGVSYPLSQLSKAASQTLAKLNKTDTILQQLQQRLAIYQTARSVYAQALRDEFA
ncbi:hypothetical protein [Vreelandella venusta]|uniref:hypothetical protein n=1 Tax=Vreelandella venusta TaxID=44935 RepID=UPI00384CF42F